MTRLEEALELLRQMVEIPSTEGNEKAMGDFLEAYTRSLGMEVEKQVVEGDRANIIARVTVGKGGKTVVLNSHMDVVPPADGWDTDPFQLVIKGDRAYGRGSTDAKGALTAFLMATKNIIENPGDTNGTIIFTAVVDEESFSKGARYLADHKSVQADYGIVGEPTMSNVYICHKGSIRPVIKIKGRSAHPSTPKLGISAVRVASYISTLVDEIEDVLAEQNHPIAGTPAISITMLKAGVKENVLPDTCELTIDRRMVPGEDEQEIICSFEEICRKAEAQFPGAQVTIDHYIVTTGPASEVKPDSQIAQIAYAACEKVTGVKQVPNGTDCNTDMNHFIRIGIPCVIIGPGTLAVAHMPNEYIEFDQLEKAYQVDEAVIRALLNS